MTHGILTNELADQVLDRIDTRWHTVRDGPIGIASGHPDRRVRDLAGSLTQALEALRDQMQFVLITYRNSDDHQQLDFNELLKRIDDSRAAARTAVDDLTNSLHVSLSQ
jgi:hypothetical protein